MVNCNGTKDDIKDYVDHNDDDDDDDDRVWVDGRNEDIVYNDNEYDEKENKDVGDHIDDNDDDGGDGNDA
ncbi:unnamed protein product [Protopolystoma xenopodis]|uniref:Uncharacterized protein n=1 Tax=Protopolystoma xenopodis TaxID=117903 RepID=A0A3S5A9E7_9PLAT|nr:unnamed protein product [Protopolystoma xenopodis]